MAQNTKSFRNLVADLEVDRDEYLRTRERFKPSVNNYVMLFTPRSGSTWLTNILSGKLGYPEEFLNPNFVRSVASAMQTVDPAEMLDILCRRKKSPNGVFGIQVRHFDITLFDQDAFFERFGNAHYFFVWRRNIVAQAVSLYKAVETGFFHSSEKQNGTHPPEVVDDDKVVSWIRHILAIEQQNHAIIMERNLRCQHVVYEEVTGNEELALKIVGEHIGQPCDVEQAVRVKEPTSKIGDDWNLEAEAFVRRKKAAVIERMERERPGEFRT